MGIFKSAQNANMSSMTSAPVFGRDWYIMRCVCSRRAIVKVFLSGTNSAHHMISTVEWLSCVFPWMPCGSNIWLPPPTPTPNFQVLLYWKMINKHTHIPRAILNMLNQSVFNVWNTLYAWVYDWGGVFLQQLAQMGMQKEVAPVPILISTLNCNWSPCVRRSLFCPALKTPHTSVAARWCAWY